MTKLTILELLEIEEKPKMVKYKKHTFRLEEIKNDYVDINSNEYLSDIYFRDNLLFGNEKLIEVVKSAILTKEEKNFLSAVIAPFRYNVSFIVKLANVGEFIQIRWKDDTPTVFPEIKKGTMFNGMENFKEYTLEELEI